MWIVLASVRFRPLWIVTVIGFPFLPFLVNEEGDSRFACHMHITMIHTLTVLYIMKKYISVTPMASDFSHAFSTVCRSIQL